MPSTPATADTWDGLLVLAENRAAVRAAERLANGLRQESPRARFARPLVLHGPVGCGKSALVKAVVNRVVGSDHARTVRVLPAAELPRESSDLADLRAADLLALEDLHHLKTADVEPLRLLLDGRSSRLLPTLFTAATGPAHLPFPRRLTNRLAAGLVVRLNPFGLDARRRFALWHSERAAVKLAPAAVEWLIRTADGPRPLAGMIDTLRTIGSAGFRELTEPDVRGHFADPLPPPSALARVVRTVCGAYKVKAKDLTGPSRLRAVLLPRQVAMYLAREVAKLPLAVIGEHFGGRDHSTVLNAVRKITAAVEGDEELAGRVRELRRGLE